MNITLNGEIKTIPPGSTVLNLLQALGLAEKRVAVEINGDIVPRSQHSTRTLSNGDQVEVVVAVGGG